MKKTALIILTLLICLISGCGYSAYKTYYNEISDYSKIWELTGFHHGYEDKSPLFPDKIDKLKVEKFLCRYDEQLPLGEGVQILLEIDYNDSDFESELNRIKNLDVKEDRNFTDSGLPAYYIKSGEDGCWEYALINEEKQTVNYIFIYSLPEKALELDKSLLPDNYADYGKSKS